MPARFFAANGAVNAVVPADVPRAANEAALVDDFLHQYFDPGTGNAALPWYNWGQPWINTGKQFAVPTITVPHATTRVPVQYRSIWAGGYPYNAAARFTPVADASKDGELAWRLDQGVPLPSSILTDNFYKGVQLTGGINPWVQPTQTTNGGGGVNDVQTLTQQGSPTGGDFKLVYTSPAQTLDYTDRIAWNASATDVQSALRAVPGIGSTGVTCTGGPLNTTPVVCTFVGPLANTDIPVLNWFDSGDSGLAIIDDTTHELWEFWEFMILRDGTPVCAYAGWMPDHTQNGGVFQDVASPYQSAQWGSSATSISITGAQISQQELIDGVIPHAVGVDLMGAADWWNFVWPAERGDGQNWSPIPEGTRFRLDPTLNPNDYSSTTPQATRTLRMLIVQMQTYGWLCWDKGGSIAIQVEPGSFDFMGNEWFNNMLHLIPMSASTLQVVDPAWRPGDVIVPDVTSTEPITPLFTPFPSAATMPANPVILTPPGTVTMTGLEHTRGLDSPTVSPTGVRQLGALAVTVVRVYRLDGLQHNRSTGDLSIRGHLSLAPTGLEHIRVQGDPKIPTAISLSGLGITHTRQLGALQLQGITVPGITRT
jgi:hypothetical protein